MTVTQARAGGPSVAEAARTARDQAVGHLLGLQHQEGWWQGELETNVTMDAEDLLLREFLGIRTEQQTAAAARWIRSCQRADGTWANFRDGDADLSTTVEAYVALRLAGDSPERRPHGPGRGLDQRPGRDRGHPRLHPHLAGPVRPVVLGRPAGDAAGADLPPGLVPAERVRLGLLGPADHRAADRGRLAAPGPAAALQPGRIRGPASPPGARSRPGRLDHALRAAWTRRCTSISAAACGLAPARAVRRAALRRSAEWIIARQERDGCWGGIQPPWVYSLIALHLLGYGLDHPVISAASLGWIGSRSGRRPRTARSGGSRRASRRSGTPCWR